MMGHRINTVIVKLDRIGQSLADLNAKVVEQRKDKNVTSIKEAQILRLAETKIEAARLSVVEAIYALGLVQ